MLQVEEAVLRMIVSACKFRINESWTGYKPIFTKSQTGV